jgi:hypothetical protein
MHRGQPSPLLTSVTRRKERENGEEEYDDMAPDMYDPHCHVTQIRHRYGTRSSGTSPSFVIARLKPQNHDSLIVLPRQLQLATNAIFSFMFKFHTCIDGGFVPSSKMALAASHVYLEREREREHQEAPRDSLQLTKKLMVTEMLLSDLCNLIMSSSGMGNGDSSGATEEAPRRTGVADLV